MKNLEEFLSGDVAYARFVEPQAALTRGSSKIRVDMSPARAIAVSAHDIRCEYKLNAGRVVSDSEIVADLQEELDQI
jgi:hypothetical protein